ncbi:MAG: poly-beta-1,6-N-acetyl-D-glucosamine biosynthesis protein PgaD [Methylomonas sp.]
MKPLIINNPDLQTIRQKYSSTLLTFVFWLIWLYLWTPLITLIAWYFGVKLFYFQMFDLRGIDEVIADAVIFYEIVACIGVSFGVWALYNYARFKNLERRKALPSVTTGQLAVFFGVEEQQIAELQDAQRISIQFDEQANMVACRAMEQAEAKPAE